MIADTSASLFAAPPDQVEFAIERALASVREFFQVDRCALLTVSADQEAVNVRLASYAEGLAPVPAGVDLAQVFPWSRRTLLVERAPVRISRVDELPPYAHVEREAWLQFPIQSALTLPIESGGMVRHLFALNTVYRECEWPESYVSRLRVLGQLLVGALDRQAVLAGLREAETRLSMAADAAEVGFWTLDFGTDCFWATDRTRSMFGYAPDEPLGTEQFPASVHPEDRDLVLSAIERSRHERHPIDVLYRIARADGSVRWIASRGRFLSATVGAPERLMGVSIDVTDHRRTEALLRRSDERLAAGADLAGLAFYEVDFGTNVVYVDERFRELCGMPPDCDAGLQPLQFWIEHLHPDDRPGVMDVRARLHDGGLERASVQYRFRSPAQGERWIEHLARVSARDAAGHAVRTFGVLRDITEAKRTEDELRELSQRLIRAHEEERALLARELHDDLTQRLAVLAIDVGCAELAARDGAQAAAMRAVREGLVRLSEDVHDLAYHLHPSVLDELGFVEALRAECERHGRQRGTDIRADLDSLRESIGKDAALCLFRVAQEALNNAARHAGGRSVTVALQRMDDGLVLAVRDDGVGFDPTLAWAGKSLGLASMRERLRLVEGTLDIDSAPGQGTGIVAWIPLEGTPA